jgi:5'-methylthioadenosine phosphorylase
MGKIGVIGGSGLYQIEGLKDTKWVKVQTPFGSPSDEYLTGILDEREIVFLPRHARGHKILPTELNYRANIYGMKKLGVDRIISISAVGSLKESIKPLDIVIPNQFVDRTNMARNTTFFGGGVVAHISFADPVCAELANIVCDVGRKLGATIHFGGTYINMEGPAFSTKAESNLYRQWGMDIIGMTNMPEAKLAREAEICYVTIAFATDYDCWRQSVVDIKEVLDNLFKNVDVAKKIIRASVGKIPKERKCVCASALKDAIVTNSSLIPKETKEKLKPIIGKYIS